MDVGVTPGGQASAASCAGMTGMTHADSSAITVWHIASIVMGFVRA